MHCRKGPPLSCSNKDKTICYSGQIPLPYEKLVVCFNQSKSQSPLVSNIFSFLIHSALSFWNEHVTILNEQSLKTILCKLFILGGLPSWNECHSPKILILFNQLTCIDMKCIYWFIFFPLHMSTTVRSIENNTIHSTCNFIYSRSFPFYRLSF